MTLEDMTSCIECSSAKNMWQLIEEESHALTRFKMRDLFFQALYCLKLHFDMPNDNWR